jgi:hypothetical protein
VQSKKKQAAKFRLYQIDKKVASIGFETQSRKINLATTKCQAKQQLFEAFNFQQIDSGLQRGRQQQQQLLVKQTAFTSLQNKPNQLM